MSLKCEDT